MHMTSRRMLIPLGTMIGLLVVAASAYFLVHASRADELTTQIDAQLNELGVKPTTIDPVLDKALRVRRAIVAGDFASARQITAGVFAASQLQDWRFYPYEDFIADVFAELPPELAGRLDEWVTKDRADATPLLLRAQYYYNLGWAKRGHDFSDKVTPQRAASFADDMKTALADVNSAKSLDQNNPYAVYLRLRILQGGGGSPAFAAAFSDGIAKFPTYYPLYELMLSTLQPRWGGTIPAMSAFVDKYAGAAPEFSPLRLLYLSLYRHLLSTASIDCGAASGDHDEMARCVVAFMNGAASPGAEQNALDALRLYDHTDERQFGLMIKGIISDMLASPGGDIYAGTVLQLAATSMHSDTQLKEKDPGHNDYVVDELVAKSWEEKGFYDNAVAKYKEALADVGRSNFPSEEEKNRALSLIYEWLSRAAWQQHQYPDAITFEKAAVLLGANWEADLICSGYYELKHYDQAVEACTDAIDSTDNSNAWYWRGQAYTQSGQQDLALADLEKATELSDYFAPYAAVDMSMIYFNRGDNQGALAVLNNYPALYDPNRTEKSQVAVAYNNRCYAYMQLGDLRRALDDCTQSLKYGSLPDAFRKQQELVERLSPSKKAL